MSAGNLAALANRIRDLRLQRSWSQEYLAGTDGLSLRTVQRVESGYACSAETLLALSAALQIQVAELTELIPPPTPDDGRFLGLTAKQSAWIGLGTALPALAFVAANLSNQMWNATWAIHYLSTVAPPLGLDSPIIILGGLILALLLNVFWIVRFEIHRRGAGIVLDGLQLRLTIGPVLVLVAGGTCLAILASYLVVENLGELLSR